MQQITLANEELREAVDGCKDGKIKGYEDLQIANINRFTEHLADLTKTLVNNVQRLIGAMSRLIKMDELSKPIKRSQLKAVPNDQRQEELAPTSQEDTRAIKRGRQQNKEAPAR